MATGNVLDENFVKKTQLSGINPLLDISAQQIVPHFESKMKEEFLTYRASIEQGEHYHDLVRIDAMVGLPAHRPLTLLPGFFIAAFAAASTFQRHEMGVEMPAPCPAINTRFENNYLPFNITRRMILLCLFSYLTILTFLIVLCGEKAIAIHPSLLVIKSSPILSSNVRPMSC